MSLDLNNYLTPSEFRALRSVRRNLPITRPSARRLQLSGYIANVVPCSFGLCRAEITITGMRYIHYRNERRRELLWTRWLAIFAVVISLFALLLELDDKGYLDQFMQAAKSGLQYLQELSE